MVINEFELNLYSLAVNVMNNGNQTLEIIDNYTTNSEFVMLNPLVDLLPGDMQLVEIVYSANAMNASGSYRIFSNDNDEGQIVCETNGNINGPTLMVAEKASDHILGKEPLARVNIKPWINDNWSSEQR